MRSSFQDRRSRAELAVVDDDIVLIERPEAPVFLTPQSGAARFAVWMREMGFAGEYTDKALRDFIGWWHHDEHVGPIPVERLLFEFSRQLGVRRERVRRRDLNPHGNNKVTLYRVMDKLSPLVRPKAEPERIRLAA